MYQGLPQKKAGNTYPCIFGVQVKPNTIQSSILNLIAPLYRTILVGCLHQVADQLFQRAHFVIVYVVEIYFQIKFVF